MDYGHDVVFFIKKKKKEVEKVTKEKTIICKISYEIKTKSSITIFKKTIYLVGFHYYI